MKLSQEQVAHFDQEGFLFFPDWFSSDEANLLLEEAALVYGIERKEVLRETSGAVSYTHLTLTTTPYV